MSLTLDEISAAMKKHTDDFEERMRTEGPQPHPRSKELTRLSYWFPLIHAAGLPVPKTEIITQPLGEHRSMMETLLNHGAFNADGEKLLEQIKLSAARIVGEEKLFFLRTDHSSAKHGWAHTCCVRDWSKLKDHVYQIIVYSEMADLMGLPTQTWAVRELLETSASFTAFDDMPIVREFRLFMRDGICEHVQGYWPPDAIDRPSVDNYRELVEQNNRIGDDELELLKTMAVAANAAVPGYWSVDFLQTTSRGWFLTDMAEGEKSFKWSND